MMAWYYLKHLEKSHIIGLGNSFSHGRVKLKYADKVRDGMKALLLPSSDYACLGAGISVKVSTYTFAMSSCYWPKNVGHKNESRR